MALQLLVSSSHDRVQLFAAMALAQKARTDLPQLPLAARPGLAGQLLQNLVAFPEYTRVHMCAAVARLAASVSGGVVFEALPLQLQQLGSASLMLEVLGLLAEELAEEPGVDGDVRQRLSSMTPLVEQTVHTAFDSGEEEAVMMGLRCIGRWSRLCKEKEEKEKKKKKKEKEKEKRERKRKEKEEFGRTFEFSCLCCCLSPPSHTHFSPSFLSSLSLIFSFFSFLFLFCASGLECL